MRKTVIIAMFAACSSRPPAPAEVMTVAATGSTSPAESTTALMDANVAILDAPTPVGPVAVALHVEPWSLTMSERNKLVVRYVVTNVTSQTIDPGMRRAELHINGQQSIMFRNSNANGGFDSTWRALPPGQQLSRELRIGETLFDKPGDYTLELVVSGIVSEPVRIHVGS